MATKVGTLSREDLAAWRRVCAKHFSVSAHPEAFAAREMVQSYLDYYDFGGQLVEAYEIDDEETWMISLFTGKIVYED